MLTPVFPASPPVRLRGEESFLLPPPVLAALERLWAAGFEAWIVGGCVRDLLLGRTPTDYDLTTSARPEQTKAVFAGERVLETGIRHGTVTVLGEGMPLEITTYRVDGGYSDARHPDGVTFSASLREDAARRDFTINAMAYAPGRGIQDFFGGREDLARGLIRAVGDPRRRFQEDALRVLRGLRFASVLSFSLEEETADAARRQAKGLGQLSAERVFQELSKLLCGPAVGPVLLAYPDILGQVIPELRPMVGFDQRSRYHCYDVYTHTAVAVAYVPPRLPLRLAMLLHDVGKPETFSLGEDGQGHFYGHAKRSAALAEEILVRLRTPKKLREEVVTLVRLHDAPVAPEGLRRWLNKLGPDGLFDLLALQGGDAAGQDSAYCTRIWQAEDLARQVRDLLDQQPCLTLRDLAVDGRDLLALGYRGPALGAALQKLLDQVLAGALPNEKGGLLQWLRENDAKKPESKKIKKSAKTC